MTGFTRLELKADEATKLNSFPVNLMEIRSKVCDLLSQVQRYGFFDEYTTHSFEHVEHMLSMTDWIIPNETFDNLTTADCLFITLSIYFHDLGLLITKDEYEKRDSNPEYKRFIQSQQSQDSDYIDYSERLSRLDIELKEKILYQEFVRKTHGARVKSWIEGSLIDNNGADSSIRSEIHQLIGKLDSVARQGLAVVCESHTIDDIADMAKYRVNMPYGNSKDETVNLQYTAIILRVVDLLQITNRRAPSVLYRIINPKDPVSQLEWQKQNAVRNIRPANGLDREGNASATAQPDTIEVFARFENSDGFFGLTSYLSYAKKQLELCQDALKKSEKLLPFPPKFPWKYIDDSGVEAVGFMTKSFGFELDQKKILDLLTGHTLYNDTNVVIRELTQNALDAVRLHYFSEGQSSENGRIDIYWDSKNKVLEVKDNGTGMSQSVIESHLLKVGSSRYQDEKFREKYPDFSSISRFGIGVLSAFMVADNVEITTCTSEDEQARQISLRSVHGKYLIKLLDKVIDRDVIGVYPNGSRIKLQLRTSAKIGDVLEVAKMWLLFPRCDVYVHIDGNDSVKIGYNSPKEALENYIQESKLIFSKNKDNIQVREYIEDGVSLAFAVVKDELFKDWGFVLCPEARRFNQDENEQPLVSLCIEGVGVEFTTPGFKRNTIISLANIVGANAPKTNVARSAIEDTQEYRDALSVIYKLYCKHVASEIERLSKMLGYSLSRAVEQVPYIIDPLCNFQFTPSKPLLLDEALSKVDFILVEDDGVRKNMSFIELRKHKHFWTINSPFMSSVEFFVREAPSNISSMTILDYLQSDGSEHKLPSGMILCNLDRNTRVDSLIRAFYEPIRFEANHDFRRITVKWGLVGKESRWISSQDVESEILQNNRMLRRFYHEIRERTRNYHQQNFYISISDDLEVVNLDDYSDFIADKNTYLHPFKSFSKMLRDIWNSDKSTKNETFLVNVLCYQLVKSLHPENTILSIEKIDRMIASHGLEAPGDLFNISDFVESYNASSFKTFSPYAWKRRDHEQ